MRRSITAAAIIGLIISANSAAGQTLPPLTVTPALVNFGNITVGGSAGESVILTNNSSGQLQVNQQISYDPNNVFSVTKQYISIAPGADFTIGVGFTPNAPGSFEGILLLSYPGPDPMSPSSTIEVSLIGQGHVGIDPAEKIGNLVLFVADALNGPNLYGVGKGKSAANRERVFLSWILQAEALILAGEFEEAHDLLSMVLRKVDGDPSPRDFVEGDAAESVALRIEEILTALEG